MSSRFVIVTTQRTGATFLRTCLDSHLEIECPGRIFPQKSVLKYISVDRRNSYYREYRTRTLTRRVAHWFDRKRLVHDCLEEAYRSSRGAKALGFKISYSNFERYPSIVSWLQSNDIKVVHWLRYNLVKRYVSKLTMNARRQAHSEKPVHRVTVYVNAGKLLSNLERQSYLIDKYREIFKAQEYLEAFYEVFVNQQDTEARRILQFLDVDDRMPLRSSLVKQNPDNLQGIIKNYDEVAQALKGTRFEKYLKTDH